MKPVVSILIPVYNVRDYIIRCLDSVAAQSYDGAMECILVDDCGTDGSIVEAQSYIDQYKGNVVFRIVHHVRNRGLAAARNTGVAAATGDFVMHLDSDDWLDPYAVEHLVKKQLETDADIVSGRALRHLDIGTIVLDDAPYETNMDLVRISIRRNYDHVIWRRLIRTALYRDQGIETVEGINVGEDHYTLPRLAYYARKVAKVDDIVYHYNSMNPNSYMGRKSQKINMKRFKNDYASLLILSDFFADKKKSLLFELYWIRLVFLFKKICQSISMVDMEACTSMLKYAFCPNSLKREYGLI